MGRVTEDRIDAALARSAALFEQIARTTRDKRGVTRPAYSPQESGVLALLAAQAREIGLETDTDAAGNLFMTLPGGNRDLPCVLMGSHADSVPQGGNYDGLAGIIAGLVCLEALHAEGFVPARDIRVMAIRGEENAWFGAQHIGSRAALGLLDWAALDSAHRSDSGRPLRAHMQEVGIDPDALQRATPALTPQSVRAYVELHIEQGPILVELGHPVGIVTGIRGNSRCARILCRGEAGHAGVVPRRLRHDAVAACAALVTAMQQDWAEREARGEDLVMTFGRFFTNPATHAVTVVPDCVELAFEARSHTAAVLRAVEQALRQQAARLAQQHGVEFAFGPWTHGQPVAMDERLVDTLQALCPALGLPVHRMASGAGHDAQDFAAAGIPSAMIFVRNTHGSHNPDEHMDMKDFAVGVRLLHALVRQESEA